MAYAVRIARRAERDLVSLYGEINVSQSTVARQWYEGLKRAILGLAARPNRCPVAPEDKRFRHLLYGRKPHLYRIVYRVDEPRKRVEVLHIRHGARRRLGSPPK